MSSTNDYESWSNDDLIARVTELEVKLRGENERVDKKNKWDFKNQKPKRDFDASRYSTRFVALKISYLGQKYNGFEYHANNTTPLPPIEEELWKALVKTKLVFKDVSDPIDFSECEYSKAGRTDKGVSAFGQVIGIRLRSNRPKPRTAHEVDGVEVPEAKPFDDIEDELPYPRILNRVLPKDIRVLAWCPTPAADFSARFSCRQRRYKYFFTQPAYCVVPGRAGISQRHHTPVEREGWLNLDAMRAAAAYFAGPHDFRNFCKQDPARQITNFERRVEKVSIEPVVSSSLGLQHLANDVFAPYRTDARKDVPQVYAFNVWGSAFLWHQVRHMVAVLFLVGQGFEKPEIVQQLLDVQTMPEKPLYEMADDHPLVLWDCVFPDLDHPEKTEDAMHWVYPEERKTDGERRSKGYSDGRYGPGGISTVVWANWHRAKIHETLSGQLLDVVAQQDIIGQEEERLQDVEEQTSFNIAPGRIFGGGATLRGGGNYVPVMARDKAESPIITNERYRQRQAEKASTSPDSIV